MFGMVAAFHAVLIESDVFLVWTGFDKKRHMLRWQETIDWEGQMCSSAS